MTLTVHPNIAKLVPYSPGKPLDELGRELGIQNAVKLASNENPLGPSPKAISVLSQELPSLHRYPDGGAHHLTAALAERWKVSPQHVIVGNGSDEVISMLVKAFVAPGDEAVMADHTFIMYKLAVTAGHGVCVEVPLQQWRHDLSGMLQAITPRTRLLFVCNPNNPTGTTVSREEIDALMAAVPGHVIVVFDEAYLEYVREPDFPDTLAFVRQNRLTISLRTFSKIYGLAGLRVGYGVTTPEITNYLHRVRNPFNANTLAQCAALAAMDDEEHVTASRTMNAAEMKVLESGLQKLGLLTVPSQANFLYFDTKRDGQIVYDRLLRAGVIVRHIRGSMIRVTIGLPPDNAKFLRALSKVITDIPVIE